MSTDDAKTNDNGVLVEFTPIYGSYDTEHNALAFLLRVDDCRILLDCGWHERFEIEHVQALKDLAGSIDAILISQPTLQHLGALPLLVGKYGCTAPIYMTIPNHKLGQMYLYDAYLAVTRVKDIHHFSLDDIDSAFRPVEYDGPCHQLRYLEERTIKGVSVIPASSGRILGGSIWRISKGPESIVYAMDWSHRTERHVPPAALTSSPLFRRPTALITDAYDAHTTSASLANNEAQEQALGSLAMQTLRAGGNVLFAADSAGRVLELLLRLDEHWTGTYPLVFLSEMGKSILQFVKTEIEWMNDRVLRRFIDEKHNPFAFKNVVVASSLDECSKVRSPKCVVASLPSLDFGHARTLFTEWCSNQKNSVFLLEKPLENTTARYLEESFIEPDPITAQAFADLTGAFAASIGLPAGSNTSVKLTMWRKLPLSDNELQEWRRKEQLKQQAAQRREEARRAEEAIEREMAAHNETVQSLSGEPVDISMNEKHGDATTISQDTGDDLGSDKDVNQNNTDLNMYGKRVNKSHDQLINGDGGILTKRQNTVQSTWRDVLKTRWAMFNQDDPLQDIESTPWGNSLPHSLLQVLDEHAEQDQEPGNLLRGLSSTIQQKTVGLDPNNEMNNNSTDSQGIEPTAKAASDIQNIPTKAVVEDIEVTVNCRVKTISFEGRADGRSMVNIFEVLAPRHIVLVHGTSEGCEWMRQRCLSNVNGCQMVSIPHTGTLLDISSHSAHFVGRFNGSFLHELHSAHVGDLEVVYLEGSIRTSESTKTNNLIPGQKSQPVQSHDVATKAEYELVLDEDVEEKETETTSLRKPLLLRVEPVRLPYVREKLAAAGIQSKFMSGALVTAHGVVIRRAQNEASAVEVEGPLNADYASVHSVLYSLHAIV